MTESAKLLIKVIVNHSLETSRSFTDHVLAGVALLLAESLEVLVMAFKELHKETKP